MIKSIALTTFARCYDRARDFVDDTWRDLETAYINHVRDELRAEVTKEIAARIESRAEAKAVREVARFLRESVRQTADGYAALLENGNWKNQTRMYSAERRAEAMKAIEKVSMPQSAAAPRAGEPGSKKLPEDYLL